jgi:hypothetical protein
MTDTRDRPSGDQSIVSTHLPASETGGSHLAHWPPPQRGREVKHVLPKHPANETDKHAKAHGLTLTRSVFKDDDDE